MLSAEVDQRRLFRLAAIERDRAPGVWKRPAGRGMKGDWGHLPTTRVRSRVSVGSGTGMADMSA